jgi:hypothetical protein
MADRGEKVQALRLKYEAEIALYKVEIENYLTHSVGVAEHPHIIESLDGLITQLTDSEDKLYSLNKYFSINLYEREL